MIRRGEEWGHPAPGAEADLEVTGDDAALAAAVAAAGSDPLVRFVPTPASDLARAVGLGRGGAAVAVPMDTLRLGDGRWAVNGVIVGVPPDGLRAWHRATPVVVEVDGVAERADATTVMVMTGQFLRGSDLSPRGHPGDGRCEVQIYMLPPGQRRSMRARIRSGAHLPHPGILVRKGRRVSIRSRRPLPVEIDGLRDAPSDQLDVELVPSAYRLLL